MGMLYIHNAKIVHVRVSMHVIFCTQQASMHSGSTFRVPVASPTSRNLDSVQERDMY